MRTKNGKHSQHPSSISKSVLIIEDDQDSADTIAEMLTVLGHKPIIENSRDMALERLKGSSFDFVLMDFRMPDQVRRWRGALDQRPRSRGA